MCGGEREERQKGEKKYRKMREREKAVWRKGKDRM